MDKHDRHMSKAPWIAAFATAGYFVCTAGVFRLFNLGISRGLEQVLSLLVAPAVLLLGLWDPVLKRLGMSKGEWFAVPDLPAFIALVVFYSAMVFAITALLSRLLQR